MRTTAAGFAWPLLFVLSANVLIVSYLSLVALAKFLISWYTRVYLKTAFCGGVRHNL